MNKWSHCDYRVYCDEDNDYGLIEVFYGTDGQILCFSEFINPIGANIKELELDLEKMASALNKPTLYYADMPANIKEEEE